MKHKKAVVSRRKIQDGVISSTEIAVDLGSENISAVVDGIDELMPSGAEVVRLQEAAAQELILSGAKGARAVDARNMLRLARAVLTAIESGDADSAVMLAVALTRFEARLNIEAVEREIKAGAKSRAGGRKGALSSAATRSGPISKQAKVLAENKIYRGAEAARIATIAKRAGATPRYARMILRKAER